MSNDSKGNGQDPWSRRPEQGPPDLIDLIRKFFKTPKKSTGGGNEPSDDVPVWRYAGIGLVLLLVLWILTGIFVVGPAEQAVILRFGRYVRTEGPGPHWIPNFIESRDIVNVQQVNNFPYQAEMLTKDENIVSVAVAVQYRISNAENYLFNVVNPFGTLQQATISALRQVVGQMTLNDVLTTGRITLTNNVDKQLNHILGLYNAGLEVRDVTLQSTKPPSAVTAAFDDAVKAREDSQRYVNKAQAYAQRITLSAKGQAARIQQEADAYKKAVVLQAKGSTARYKALLAAYLRARTVTRERLYLDTVSSVLSKTSNIVVDSNGTNVLYLPLEQILKHQMQQVKSQSLTLSTNGDAKSAGVSNTTTTALPVPSSTSSSLSGRPSYPLTEGGNS